MLTLSIVIPVLDSHEQVRRLARHLARAMPSDCEALFVDDGSDPPLALEPGTPASIRMIATHDARPWTQPRARNIGAKATSAPWIFFLDADHIPPAASLVWAMIKARETSAVRLRFNRRYMALDEAGGIVTDAARLIALGMGPTDGLWIDPSPSCQVIRRDAFDAVGGFDERFCGRYGGDDLDLNARLDAQFPMSGNPGPLIGVWPNNRAFHSLSRADGARADEILARLPDGPVSGAEIGVLFADTSARLLRARKDLKLTLVDPWAAGTVDRCPQSDWDDRYRRAMAATAFADDEGRRRVLRMHSVAAAAHVRNQWLDFVFIDSDHRYVAVASDLDAWAPKVKPGGLLCGHDYGIEHLRPTYGVTQAVDEFAAARRLAVDRGDDSTWFIRLPMEAHA